MSNQTQAVTKKTDTLEMILARPAIATRFKEVLGQRAPQFMSSIISLGRGMPDVEPRSIVGACMQAATLDLPIERNLGFAWVVPYKSGGIKYAQFQMGYKGYVQLALRTGRYERMNAVPINGEAYRGRDAIGEPIIDWDKLDELKPAVGYVFAFKLVSGFTKVVYWSKEKVIAHANRYSKAYRNRDQDSPWEKEFDKMALKTLIGNTLSDWGILSVEWQVARRLDQGVVMDVDADVTFLDNAEGAAEDPNATKAQATGHQQATQGTAKDAPPKEKKAKVEEVKTAEAPPAETQAPPAPPASATNPDPSVSKEDNIPMEFPPEDPPETAQDAPKPSNPAETPSEGQTPTSTPAAEAEPGKSETTTPVPEAQQPEIPPDPLLGPQEGDTDAVASVKLLAQKSGINWFQLRTYLLAKHLMRPEQKKLAELAVSKLENIARNLHKWIPEIKALPLGA